VSFRVDLFLPELYFLGLIALLFIQTLGILGHPERTDWAPIAGVGAIFAALIGLPASGSLFWGAYQVDALSQFFKAAVALGFTIAALNATQQPTLDKDKHADYFLLLALSSFGLMILASAVELVTIYLALEISSYSLYALIPLRDKDPRAAEAGIKYILFGAAATALALFGLSYVIAVQNSTYLEVLATKPWSFSAAPLAVIGLTAFFIGFLFKLALFPFHFWCPDLYQGASNETAAYAATLPKLGAVVILVRLASLLSPGLEITTILAVLGAISMTYGNLAALAQKDIKRLLGYSSVAHAGYVMLGLVSGTPQGFAAAAFYSLVYVVMNLTCFWVISSISTEGKNITLDDLNGLHEKAPMLAFTLGVAAFSLVGLPPTAGFMGKLFLLTSAWNHGYNWLVFVAVLNTAIAIFYYLNLVRYAYTSDSGSQAEPITSFRAGSKFWAAILAGLVLFLGVYPGPVFEWAVAAGVQLIP